MLVHVKALDSDGAVIFEGHVAVNPISLVVLAESREELTRAKGEVYARGVVPHMAVQLLEAAQEGQPDDELHRLTLDLAMAAWLAESIYGGLTAEEFVRSNLHFTYLPSGAVKYDRLHVEASQS